MKPVSHNPTKDVGICIREPADSYFKVADFDPRRLKEWVDMMCSIFGDESDVHLIYLVSKGGVALAVHGPEQNPLVVCVSKRTDEK